jgi:uncharacterized Zn-binding protein involved in type VI secretion
LKFILHTSYFKREAMPLAAKLHHFCPLTMPPTANTPHVSAGQLITPTVTNVMISGSPAVIVGDTCICLDTPNKVVAGSATVMINNKPAARMGDSTAHGGMIDQGVATVMIGG